MEKYLNSVAVKEKDDKKEGGKERKQDKMVTLSYKDNAFIHKLRTCFIIQSKKKSKIMKKTFKKKR